MACGWCKSQGNVWFDNLRVCPPAGLRGASRHHAGCSGLRQQNGRSGKVRRAQDLESWAPDRQGRCGKVATNGRAYQPCSEWPAVKVSNSELKPTRRRESDHTQRGVFLSALAPLRGRCAPSLAKSLRQTLNEYFNERRHCELIEAPPG